MVENVRFTNTRDLYHYMELCRQLDDLPAEEYLDIEPLSRQAQMEEFMFLGLRMKEGVTRTKFETEFGMPIEAVYRDVMEELKREGLLQSAEGRIRLTDKGMDLANYCMAKFLL